MSDVSAPSANDAAKDPAGHPIHHPVDDGHAPSPARREAWLALSELFLDTALDAADIAAIARRLRATGLPAGALQQLYQHEVAPVCWRNLQAVPGGAWAGFEPAWLVNAVQQHLARPPLLHAWKPLQHWRVTRWTARTRDDWLRVKALLV